MNLEEALTQVAQLLEKQGNSHAVFGDAVKLEHHTVVPVASVSLGGGMGGTNGLPGIAGKAASAVAKVFGFGFGGGIDVRPVGFISERDGEVVFTHIHVDGKGTPLITEAANGIGRVVGTVTALFTPREFSKEKLAEKPEKRPIARA